VNTGNLRDRWSAALAALRRGPFPPAGLSRWAWAADAVLAVALAIGALNGALNRVGDSSESLTQPALPMTPPGVPAAPSAPIGIVTHHYGAAAPWQLALALLVTLPLVLRRRYPLTAWSSPRARCTTSAPGSTPRSPSPPV
jgi:hypothetical protein